MKIAVPHHTTRAEARRILEHKMSQVEAQYAHYASDIQKSWNGDRLDFTVKARGFSGSGTLEVTEREVIIDGKLPLIARPFEPRIRSTIEREAEDLFRKA